MNNTSKMLKKCIRNYIEGCFKMEKENMVFVGTFNEKELREGVDKKEIAKAKKEHGLNYIESKIVKKGGKPVAMKVWVCDYKSFTL